MRKIDQSMHCFTRRLWISCPDRLVDAPVLGDRITGQSPAAMLENGRPLDGCADTRAEDDQGIVACGPQYRSVEVAVGGASSLGREGVLSHGRQSRLHGLQVCQGAPFGGERCGGRLDNGTQLEELADEVDVGFCREGPGKHFRIEQIPACPGQDPRARLGSALDQTLGDQNLNGLPIGSAGHAQRLGKFHLSGEGAAGGVLAGKDGRSQPVGNLVMQPSPGACPRFAPQATSRLVREGVLADHGSVLPPCHLHVFKHISKLRADVQAGRLMRVTKPARNRPSDPKWGET
jgi:hypothetical protein